MMEQHEIWNAVDPFGIAIVVAGAIVTVWAFVFTLRCLEAPGEIDPSHPKYSILAEDR
jgi:hypothetical protein